jgi:hypothetical protein
VGIEGVMYLVAHLCRTKHPLLLGEQVPKAWFAGGYWKVSRFRMEWYVGINEVVVLNKWANVPPLANRKQDTKHFQASLPHHADLDRKGILIFKDGPE